MMLKSQKWVTIAALLLVLCGCQKISNKVDIPSVEKDIRAHLPIGCSKTNVIAFLDARKITRERLQKAESAPNGKVIFPDSHTEVGVIRDAATQGWYAGDIYIEFKFDTNDSNLVSYKVYAIYKGL